MAQCCQSLKVLASVVSGPWYLQAYHVTRQTRLTCLLISCQLLNDRCVLEELTGKVKEWYFSLSQVFSSNTSKIMWFFPEKSSTPGMSHPTSPGI